MALACLLWLLFVTVYDFRQRRVPNWLVLAGALSALAALGLGMQPFGIGWTAALLGAVVGFVFLLLFHVFGVMGAGDVKFAGVLGLWVGLSALAPIWIVASLLAGLHALAWLLLQRWPVLPRLSQMLRNEQHTSSSADAKSPRSRAKFIPYAAYLAMATAGWLAWARPG